MRSNTDLVLQPWFQSYIQLLPHLYVDVCFLYMLFSLRWFNRYWSWITALSSSRLWSCILLCSGYSINNSIHAINIILDALLTGLYKQHLQINDAFLVFLCFGTSYFLLDSSLVLCEIYIPIGLLRQLLCINCLIEWIEGNQEYKSKNTGRTSTLFFPTFPIQCTDRKSVV